MSVDVQISTVLLCWNRLQLSRRCLKAYLATTRVLHEIFVVDNGSTDGTAEWLESIAHDSRVTGVLRMRRNDPAVALNLALERCRGRLLHVLENDYLVHEGWDEYVVDRFARLPELGQLGIATPAPETAAERVRDLVVGARRNVTTCSVFRREVYFDDGIRWRGHYRRGTYPDDVAFSDAIRATGRLVAWPDRELAVNLGHSDEELARDPGYYLRDHALKLFSLDSLAGTLRELARSKFGLRRHPELRFQRVRLALLARLARLRLRAFLGKGGRTP